MRKLALALGIVLVLMSCKSTKHSCDAYGCKEKIVKNVVSV